MCGVLASPHTIANAIATSAINLQKIGLKPFILPILNRKLSYHCTAPNFNKDRQKVNRLLRSMHPTYPYITVINIPQLLPLSSDQVHLTPHSYKIITGHVVRHIQKSFPKLPFSPNPLPFDYKIFVKQRTVTFEETSEIISSDSGPSLEAAAGSQIRLAPFPPPSNSTRLRSNTPKNSRL